MNMNNFALLKVKVFVNLAKIEKNWYRNIIAQLVFHFGKNARLVKGVLKMEKMEPVAFASLALKKI